MAGRPRKKVQDEGQVEVKRVQYENGQLTEETDEVETIKCVVFGDVEPARLRVGGSITRQPIPFNSIRVDISLDLPALPEMSELDRVYDLASNFVENKIQAELADAIAKRSPNTGFNEEQLIAKTESKPGIRRRVAG